MWFAVMASAPSRSASDQATRRARVMPRIVRSPRSKARSRSRRTSSGREARSRRSHVPSTSALSRHGVPARRAALRARASCTRVLTSALVGARPTPFACSARCAALGGATRSCRSMRSRSGPEMRETYRRRAFGGQEHCCSSAPHGHGFAASTSWQRAGNSATP